MTTQRKKKTMKKTEFVSWTLYWVGIAFILACLSTALTAGAQADPCQWEIDNAKSVCRSLGRRSNECQAAIDKVKLCRAIGDDDPIAGLGQVCRTECFVSSNGTYICTTTCEDTAL